MATSELSLIRFGVLNFFHLVITSQPFSPVTTKLLKMIEALIYSEPEKDLELHNRIKWIRQMTHEKVNLPLSVVEYVVFNNLDKTRNFSREIDVNNKPFNLIFLYKVLDEISTELTEIAVSIAKKYSVDMPILNYGSQQKSNIEI